MTTQKVPKPKKRFDLSQNAAAGAVLAAFFAALWVIDYTMNTSWGERGGYSTPIIDFVLGREYGMDEGALGILIVVVTRFIIAFGITWAPLTAAIGWVKGFKKN
ncbi:MAG TPA: hypothetical protein QGI30_01780 [Anaerolineales bacterium]|jgi:hypothetical protein|nr:hypothetical protein [Anaerolineales bacterium]HJO33128.1 hypothetical protein [Anaerolineales bacterium]|tara:strand:- start:555 stop:866 length:312 start_codon:yes stop_codon:yes gene_type:complete